MKDILIHGTGSMGKLLFSEMKEDTRFNVKAFVCDDCYYTKSSIMGCPVYKVSEVKNYFNINEVEAISTGSYSSPRERWASYLNFKKLGFKLCNFISQRATVASDLVIGENNIIFSGVYLDYFGKLGNCNVIRPNTYIGHNFDIHNGVYIAPGVHIAGYSTIEDLSFIGISSTLLERLVIRKETLIGAASLMTKSSEPYCQYIGSPAKKVKSHEEIGIKL